MKLSISLPVLFAALVLSACGGGSSGGSSDGSGVTAPADNNPVDTGTNGATDASANLQTGRFVDSAVIGLQYTTATQSGETGTDGSFSYQSGENITFSIGDINLPTVPASALMTPLTVFSTDNITDIRVMNLAQLLQTLDTDGNPVNGITLSDQANASATGISVDFASPNFANQVVNLVANSGSVNTTLVNGIEALDHLQETLFQEGIDERPPAAVPPENQPAPSANNSSTHPLVGTSAEFSDFAHDISGTLTVLDDRTLQVTNFNYDGGGVVVFFYTGLNGDYRNGQEIGPMLNGRPYNDETITLTIPDNLTLDDFNGLSVWCVPFNANFGDAQL